MNNEHTTPTAEDPYRWVMLGLLWLLYFAFGIVVRSISPLVTPILRDLGMSYGQMGFVLGSWQMTYIAFAILAGVIMDRWGIRNSIFFGTLVMGLSISLRFFANGFATLLIFVALFGIGGPMISIGAPKTISIWFKGRDRGTAVGIYTAGPWIGGMVALAITNSLIMPLTGQSWRLTFVCYGAMTFLFAALWWLLAKEVGAGGDSAGFNPHRVLLDLIKVPAVRIILLSGLLSFAMMHGFTNWLPKILENAGLSPANAGVAAALPFVASIPAVLAIPRLVPQTMRGSIIALAALLTAAAIILVTLGYLRILGLLLYGFAGSCVFPLLILALIDAPHVGPEYLGSAAGVFFCVAEIGGFWGPFIVGFLVDWTGTFMAGVSFLAFLGLVICVLMFFLRAQSAITDTQSE
jgi:cyanate permease